MIIGITGSIGSGKTTVSGILKKYGFKIINADEIGHEIIEKNSSAYNKIISTFGKEILDNKKNINRKKLGDIVFSDKNKLKKLNLIMHPIINHEIKKEISKLKRNNIAVDVPLLFESKMQKMFDKVLVVAADEKVIFRRLNKEYSKEKIKKILQNQMSLGKKIKMADFVIYNNKGLKYLNGQVRKIIEKLKQKT